MKIFSKISVFAIMLSFIILLPPVVMASEKGYLDYTVKKGDTLWDITGGKLSDYFLWPKVWERNPEIKNPDLIFPGQKIRIPLDLVQQQIDVPPPVKKVLQGKEPAGKEQIPISPGRPVIVSGDLIASSGYIERDMPRIGKIDSTPSGRTIVGRGDSVYITLSDGAGGEKGRKFYTIRSHGIIRHPKTNEDLGQLIEITGVIEITGREAGFIKAKVIKSYVDIQTGEGLDKYYPVSSFPLERKSPSPSIHGMVVAARDLRQINGMGDIVYIDRGTMDGVMPGNSFALLSGSKPHRPVGKIQVIAARKTNSVAMVTRSEVEISRGDYF